MAPRIQGATMILTGLVPKRKLCKQIHAIRVLREAFKDTALIWYEGDDGWVVVPRSSILYSSLDLLSAPTVQEMQPILESLGYVVGWGNDPHCNHWVVVVHDEIYHVTDPDALAQAYIAAVTEQP
jgi:hypothetical protein